MDTLLNIWPLLIMMLATGVVGGILAGLLGVGGGIVIVPVLELALTFLKVEPSIRMHIAVATSLMTIIPTSISSARAHHKKGSIDLAVVKRWAVPIVLGSVIGTLIASQVDSRVLASIFGVIALLVAIKMFLPLENYTIAQDIPNTSAALAMPTGIGVLSSLMGIGGGTLSVPIFTLLNQPIHRAVGTAALFGLLVSIPGTIGYIFGGMGHSDLPFGNIGYVSVIGFMIIAPVTVLTAPLGARIAHMLSQRHLSMAFGAFLFVVAVRMIYRAIAG